ncbi:MAG: S1C family serine protease [Bacillota bacterium]
MKNLLFLPLLMIFLLTNPLVVLSQEYYIQTRQLDGQTYVKLQDIQHLFRELPSQCTIIFQPQTQDEVKDVINKVNESVVAIIGEDKTIKNDDYYSKIPAGLMHGSGVIVSEDGRIVTNNHVVENMKEIYVILSSKKAYKAQLLYKNKDIDLALIKINKTGLKPITFEKMENVRAGDEVIAIGTPLFLGWSNSASKGIISGLNRPVDQTYTFLQTDAHIYPGNSGGPLINMDAKLVGINTLGIQWYQGINFCIPVDNVEYFLDQYDKYGRIRRACLGLELEESWLAVVGIPSNQGLKVIGYKENCAVDKTKVLEGDVLKAVDGHPVTSIAGYNEVLKEKSPGESIKLTFVRNTSEFTVVAKLLDYPEER